MVNASTLVEGFIEHVPSWAYLLLVLAALGTSTYLANIGLRACGGLVGKVRRRLV